MLQPQNQNQSSSIGTPSIQTSQIRGEEVNALMTYCGVDGQARVQSETFKRVVTSGPTKFQQSEEYLSNALIKLRIGLYSNLSEQFNNFKFMPSNFISSFTEDLFLKGSANLPSSTLRPTLGDSKFYYSNLFPPISTQEKSQTKVSL